MVFLTKEEERMLNGEYGAATQEAMGILVKIAEAYDAERLLPAKSAHVAAGLFPEEIEWYERLLQGGARFRCFTTRHPWGIDYEHFEEVGTVYGNTPEIKQIAEMLFSYSLKMGAVPMGTCIQYLLGDFLMRGDTFSWTGSSGVVFANSVLGARGNMDGAVTNYCVAITGRIPEYGMLLDENRRAQVLIDCSRIDFDQFTDADYGALAFHVGKVVGNEIPVFVGMPKKLTLEQLRAIASPLHVSGAVPMFHIPGITPEAPSLEVASGGEKLEKVQVDMNDVKAAYDEIATTGEEKLDMVCIGCPHLTYTEIREIAEFLDGKKVHPDVKLWVGTSYQVKVVADRAGWTEKIENAGGLLVTNICMGPGNPCAARGARIVATNSPRSAYYTPKVEHLFGSTRECLETAISGRWRGKR
ncbi:MAG: aconitase X catalytic domain-containing protein [Archaeoglobi archaeon]|jgi:predicted aconitase|nr:aconitase X catalytic domain-containing protein [Archaeoglobi archaeon]